MNRRWNWRLLFRVKLLQRNEPIDLLILCLVLLLPRFDAVRQGNVTRSDHDTCPERRESSSAQHQHLKVLPPGEWFVHRHTARTMSPTESEESAAISVATDHEGRELPSLLLIHDSS